MGAGKYGLNLGARLKSLGLSVLLIDKNQRVGDLAPQMQDPRETRPASVYTHGFHEVPRELAIVHAKRQIGGLVRAVREYHGAQYMDEFNYQLGGISRQYTDVDSGPVQGRRFDKVDEAIARCVLHRPCWRAPRTYLSWTGIVRRNGVPWQSAQTQVSMASFLERESS